MLGFINDKGEKSEPDNHDFMAAAHFVMMLRKAGVRKLEVLRALEQIARVPFLPTEQHILADEDAYLPLPYGQMMLKPSLAGIMLEDCALEKHHRILHIGTGSGYFAALLAKLTDEVISVERVKQLADDAHNRLKTLKIHNVEVHWGDGLRGISEHAPYDRIVFCAALETIPEHFLDALPEGGFILAPIGQKGEKHQLTRITRKGKNLEPEPLGHYCYLTMLMDDVRG